MLVLQVVLLCGKPGLGKTTLAHVVARHAGYNVIEMNASDERTAQSFRDKVEDSLTMKPLFGTIDPRPNCLVIDEIDGAPAVSFAYFCYPSAISQTPKCTEHFWMICPNFADVRQRVYELVIAKKSFCLSSMASWVACGVGVSWVYLLCNKKSTSYTMGSRQPLVNLDCLWVGPQTLCLCTNGLYLPA